MTDPSPAPPLDPPLRRALMRYRVLALVTGVLINILYFIGIPLQIADHPGVVHVVGALHGAAFIFYVLTILDLGYRSRWPIVRILLVMSAGLLPVMTFVAERRVVHNVAAWAAARRSAPPETEPAEPAEA
jgi:integral membrane protein